MASNGDRGDAHLVYCMAEVVSRFGFSIDWGEISVSESEREALEPCICCWTFCPMVVLFGHSFFVFIADLEGGISMASVKEVIEDKLNRKVQEKKDELSGTVVLEIAGDGGGTWTINCDEAIITNTDTENPTVRIKMGDEDFLAMIAGDLNPASAMFTGKLKIEGDMAMATKLATVIV